MPHSAQTKTTSELPPRISKRGRINEGRPTTYKPEYCDEVIELGKQGCSFHEMALKLNTFVDVMRGWLVNFPEFNAAMSRARALAQSWWEEQGRIGLYDTTEGEGKDRVTKRINANLYSLQVRNRFPQDWKDKQDLEVSGVNGGPIQLEAMSVEQIRAELAKRGALRAEVIPQESAKQLTDTTITSVQDAEVISDDVSRCKGQNK